MNANLKNLTLGDIEEIQKLFPTNNPIVINSTAQESAEPWQIGKNYFIRTVTHHYTGTLTAVYPTELTLAKAAWIADDGRLTDALAKESFSEVEMYPADRLVIIGRASVLDAVEIKVIPTSQK
jgi:hypothetical protein